MLCWSFVILFICRQKKLPISITFWMIQTLKTCLIETFVLLIAVNSRSVGLTSTINVSQDINCSCFNHLEQLSHSDNCYTAHFVSLKYGFNGT